MSGKTFRPGQFGIFTVVEKGNDLNRIITNALPAVTCLRLKSVEWVDLGSQIMAILFSSFRAQIYLSEWQVIFKHMFANALGADQLRENSKRVARIVGEARQLNPLSLNHFEIAIDDMSTYGPKATKSTKSVAATPVPPFPPVLPEISMVDQTHHQIRQTMRAQYQLYQQDYPQLPMATTTALFQQRISAQQSDNSSPINRPKSSLANQLGNGLGISKKRLDFHEPDTGNNGNTDSEPQAKRSAFTPMNEPAGMPTPPVYGPQVDAPTPTEAIRASTPKENPFILYGRREQLLKLFLVTSRPCWNPALLPFRAKGSTEDLLTYADQRKSYYNRQPPKIASIINFFIPAIARRSHGNHELLLHLDASHLDTLTKIYQWHHAPAWKGMMALFPWNSLECTRYDFGCSSSDPGYGGPGSSSIQPSIQPSIHSSDPSIHPSIHPSASVLEAHRRALELERACQDLTEYLYRSMTKTDYIHGFTAPHLKRSLAVIAAGGGLFGTGKDFWTPAPGSLQAIERLTKAGASRLDEPMAEQIEWLRAHRAAAFLRTYTVTTELDWGIPILGLCYKHQATLAHLDEKDKAEGMLQILQSDVQERVSLYIMDLEPLLLYGGRLTRYVRDLHALCAEHFSILGRIPGTKHRLSFPHNCKLLNINQEGRLIGPDGQPMPAGHFALPNASLADEDSRPPLPFPDACCDLQPNETALQELADARRTKEERLLKDMLTSVLGTCDEPNTIIAMRCGKHNVLRRMRDDSHQSRSTAVLPPTASMPSAAYAPDVLFKQ